MQARRYLGAGSLNQNPVDKMVWRCLALPMCSRREALALIAVQATGLWVVGCGADAVTVHLVRHAEKAVPLDGSKDKDPALSEKGSARAAALATALSTVKLSAVFASEWRRTQDTVAPTAKAQGLNVEVMKADDTPALVVKLKTYSGKHVLVAGHSNTVPEIAAALGLPEPPKLGDDDYGDLFVVKAGASGATLEKRRFEG